MAKKYLIKDKNQNQNTNYLEVDICDTFYSKLMGLMFKKEIEPSKGIILVQDKPSKINAAIHMFFMNFDIAVFWLDENKKIVDKTLAKKWRPFYMPCNEALMIIETHPLNIENYKIGDSLHFEEI